MFSAPMVSKKHPMGKNGQAQLHMTTKQMIETSQFFPECLHSRELNGRGFMVQLVWSSFLRSAFFLLAAGNCCKMQGAAGNDLFR